MFAVSARLGRTCLVRWICLLSAALGAQACQWRLGFDHPPAACDGVLDCRPDEVCAGGTCVPDGGDGFANGGGDTDGGGDGDGDGDTDGDGSGPCIDNTECLEVCVHGTCAARAGHAAACDEPADCLPGLTCSSDACLFADGETCGANADCLNVCIQGACAEPSGSGGACDENADCAGGAECPAGVCEVVAFVISDEPLGAYDNADVAVDGGGGAAVTYEVIEADGTHRVYFQRLGVDGAAAAPPVRLRGGATEHDMRPALAAAPDGSFLVVWEYLLAADVMAQWFESDGTARSGPARLNDFTSGDQMRPRPAVGADGAALVVWMSWNQDGDAFGVYGRMLASDGSLPGAELHLPTSAAGYQDNPEVAARSGGFVVTWETPNTTHDDVVVRLFDADGAPVSGEIGVATDTTGHQWEPHVASLADGGFAVSWYGHTPQSGYFSVSARLFDPGGAPRGTDFLLPLYDDTQEQPEVAAGSAGGCAVWQSRNQDGDGWGIFARRLDATGTPAGGEIAVNDVTAGAQTNPAVAMAPESGGFFVVWESDPLDGSDARLYGQRFNAAGEPLGRAPW